VTVEPDKLNDWLKAVGLEFNPFLPLEAGADSRLSTYLVGHEDFATLWGDWPAFLFAPAGGGKSAFRVRLAYACRAGEDGRRIFPIVYHLPRGPLSFDEHLHAINRAAAHELLLELAWRPGRFEMLGPKMRQEVRRLFDWNEPGLLDRFLPQLREDGSPMPIVQACDPSAAHLPNPPAPSHVRALCDALQALPKAIDAPSPRERFNHLLHVSLALLKRQAVYILVDSVDAHPETIQAPAEAFEWLCPLVDHSSTWVKRNVFLKLFLPEELGNFLQDKPNSLTIQIKSAKIKWTPERLVQMLQARVQVASGGKFGSLDAISSPVLHRVEETLIEKAAPIPRELLVLAGRVLLEHVRRVGPAGLLEPEDLEAAITFFTSHNQNTEP
jgi:hypothetical protein